jgi:DNA-binding XRE family transcriptional regulator
MAWLSPHDAYAADRLSAFGRIVRRARQCAGLSQQRLADLSGVSQTSISRLERGKAPHLALDRLLAMQVVLGGCLPLGLCPHDHPCIWQPRSALDRESLHRPALVKGLSFRWPRDEVPPWADQYPERERAADGGPESPRTASQSPTETEGTSPTGLATGRGCRIPDDSR